MSEHRVVLVSDHGETILPDRFNVSSSGISLTELMNKAMALAKSHVCHSCRLEWWSECRKLWHSSMTVRVNHQAPTETVLCGN
jgi:hypothetical protein